MTPLNLFSPSQNVSVRDTIQNFTNLLGSAIDPNQGANYRSDCHADLWDWRKNGGVAKKVINYWPDKMATGFEINVATLKQNKSASDKALILKNWLKEQFQELDLISILHEAELQCQVDRAAPLVMLTDGRESLSEFPRRFAQVTGLMIQDPIYFEPLTQYADQGYRIDHKMVYAYTRQSIGMFNPTVGNNIIDAARVLPLQGEKLLASERHSNIYDRWWGRPLISKATVDAALKLDMAIAAASILIQQKNTTVIGIRGLFEQITRSANGQDDVLGDVVNLLKTWEAGRNLLNVNVIDMENQSATYLDRNTAGVADLVQKLKENFLMHVDNIPETELFGQLSHGGLSRSNDDHESVNDTANERFTRRWLPQINKLVALMLRGKNCPVSGYNPSMVSIARVPSFAPSAMDQAKLRAITVATDERLIKNEVITAQEARQRETGAGYQTSLNL
jgi:Protein of unknown function (DUF1073)